MCAFACACACHESLSSAPAYTCVARVELTMDDSCCSEVFACTSVCSCVYVCVCVCVYVSVGVIVLVSSYSALIFQSIRVWKKRSLFYENLDSLPRTGWYG